MATLRGFRDWRALGIGALTDAEVARKAGCTREHVRQMRGKLGIPVNREAYRARVRAASVQRAARRYEARDRRAAGLHARGLSVNAIAAELRVSWNAARNSLERFGIEPRLRRPREIDWASVDWRRSNVEIGRRLRAHANLVSRWRRKLGR